jgi:hypothetical protein
MSLPNASSLVWTGRSLGCMLQAKLAESAHLLFFANLLGSVGTTIAYSTHEALKGQQGKCEAIAEHCKCLVDEKSNSTCAETWPRNVTAEEVESAMACDVTLGKSGSILVQFRWLPQLKTTYVLICHLKVSAVPWQSVVFLAMRELHRVDARLNGETRKLSGFVLCLQVAC